MQRVCSPPSLRHMRGHVIRMHLHGDVNLNLVKVASARVLHCKDAIFPSRPLLEGSHGGRLTAKEEGNELHL